MKEGGENETDEVDVKSFVLWIPRGIAAAKPRHAEDLDVVDETNDVTMSQDDDNNESAAARLDEMKGSSFFGVRGEDIELIQKGDPLLKDTEDSDEEDLEIHHDRELALVVGSVEKGDLCSVETLLYSQEDKQTYFHHDTMIASVPLCGDLLSFYEGQKIAVSSFLPIIEIWDNDVIGVLEPIATLGDPTGKGQGNHTDAIASIQANRLVPDLLLSASHDRSLRVWDLNTKRVNYVFERSKDKLNVGKWHPAEATLLALGGDDASIYITDTRVPVSDCNYHVISVNGSTVEDLIWYRHDPNLLLAVGGTSSGDFFGYDVRMLGENKVKAQLWETTPSDVPLLTLCDTMAVGVIVTAGDEGMAHIWDIRNGLTDGPKQVDTKDLKIGPLFCCAASPDEATGGLVAFGGNDIAIWDLTASELVISTFQT